MFIRPRAAGRSDNGKVVFQIAALIQIKKRRVQFPLCQIPRSAKNDKQCLLFSIIHWYLGEMPQYEAWWTTVSRAPFFQNFDLSPSICLFVLSQGTTIYILLIWTDFNKDFAFRCSKKSQEKLGSAYNSDYLNHFINHHRFKVSGLWDMNPNGFQTTIYIDTNNLSDQSKP